MTSPPFALLGRACGTGQREYVGWLKEFGRLVHQTDAGWQFRPRPWGRIPEGHACSGALQLPRPPGILRRIGFFLAEDYWFNPSKLRPHRMGQQAEDAPSSVNTVWWFSKTEWPSRTSQGAGEYSDRMRNCSLIEILSRRSARRGTTLARASAQIAAVRYLRTC